MQTEIIKVTEDSSVTELLAPAAEIIRQGGLVVFPTETVYGLGADATNPLATAKIYEAKGRPSDNPLIIHVSTPEEAEHYAFTNSLYYSLAEAFMPGPLTVILKARESIPLTTRGGLDTVAVRCPESEIARELIRQAGVPIAAPSANLSGSPSPTNASHVIDDMMGRVDAIIDGGDSDFGLESTIVKIDSETTVTLLRPGKITVEDISSIGVDVRLANAVTESMKTDEIALSPGMKYKHYAPSAPLFLVESTPEQYAEYILANSDSKNIAVICYDDESDYLSDKIPFADFYMFGKRSDKMAQAHMLFKVLRDTDKKTYSKIYAPLPSKDGIGLALYNRMIRAAAHKIIRL